MEKPRPYIVTYSTGTDRHDDHVSAFTLMEALQQVAVRAEARGHHVHQLIDAGPDVDAIAKQEDYERALRSADLAAATARVRDVFRAR
jgi:hypothetical protein